MCDCVLKSPLHTPSNVSSTSQTLTHLLVILNYKVSLTGVCGPDLISASTSTLFKIVPQDSLLQTRNHALSPSSLHVRSVDARQAHWRSYGFALKPFAISLDHSLHCLSFFDKSTIARHHQDLIPRTPCKPCAFKY